LLKEVCRPSNIVDGRFSIARIAGVEDLVALRGAIVDIVFDLLQLIGVNRLNVYAGRQRIVGFGNRRQQIGIIGAGRLIVFKGLGFAFSKIVSVIVIMAIAAIASQTLRPKLTKPFLKIRSAEINLRFQLMWRGTSLEPYR
jgi:hypothetical protein